jgi:molybdenum cofactor cytidylyltransferase
MEKAVDRNPRIAAIVLAAGLSTRMGEQKLLLPWGNKTVIEQIAGIIHQSGLDPIIVVTGKDDDKLNSILDQVNVTRVVNAEYENSSMVTSLQKGLNAIQRKDIQASMVFLGDQPTVQEYTVRSIVEAFENSGSEIVIPSFQFHQGHPWLVKRKLWSEIRELNSKNTMQEFLSQHKKVIQYVIVDTPSVLQDMDTPEDFQKIKPV